MKACPECGEPWQLDTLSCPGCRRLVHRERLEELAALAASADPPRATELWQQALSLLPGTSKQRRQIEERIAALSQARQPRRNVPRWLAGLGATGLLLWKLKGVLVFLLSKGKVLLLGLTKWKTLLSMFLALGVYWTIWGWQFALGFVLSIYVHEMGHVIALRHYGIPASAPMFIPGVGAFVRLHQHPKTTVEDARIGLAGPWGGLAAALLCLGVFLVTGSGLFAALARTGAWINLFNLIPIWQLDGGRSFNGLVKSQRLLAAGVVLVAWYVTGETMLLLILLGAAFRAFATAPANEPDHPGLLAYVVLIVIFSAMLGIPVPGVP